MPKIPVESLGDFLREQRRSAQLSLRQLAAQAGVSNPYLSQIERGVRKPSAEILQQIAKGLRISSEQLYVQAGILDDRPVSDRTVEAALLADAAISEHQKQVLLEIYRAFCAESAATVHATSSSEPATKSATTKPAAKKPATKRSATKRSATKKRATKESTTANAPTKRSAARP